MERNRVMTVSIPDYKEEDFRLFTVLNGGKIESVEEKKYEYKGYSIEPMMNGYTVCYCGDEVYFDTVEEAVNFINEVDKKEKYEVTFIWGHSLKIVTTCVSADSEEEAVDIAFENAGKAFENRLISVRRCK